MNDANVLNIALHATLDFIELVHAESSFVASVTVVGHYGNAVGTSDAASEGTVTSGLIRNRPALRTGELLEFVPGMIVTQHSGGGKANQYFLRGSDVDYLYRSRLRGEPAEGLEDIHFHPVEPRSVRLTLARSF